MAASKEFRKAMEASKNATKRFKKAKDARPGGDFSAPDIEDGRYEVRVTAEADKSPNKNIPFVRINWMVLNGDYAKTKFNAMYWLEGDDEERVQKDWDNLSKAIQVLLGMDEEDMEGFEQWSMSDLCDVVDEIDEKAPLALIRIKNWKSEKSSGINTYFLELLDEADVTIEVDDEAEGEPEEEEEEKPAASGRTKTRTRPKKEEVKEEEPEQEEEEEVVISKDDYVEYKPPRSRKAIECQVVSSNKTKEECTLVAVEDESKKFTAVKWDDVVLLVEE